MCYSFINLQSKLLKILKKGKLNDLKKINNLCDTEIKFSKSGNLHRATPLWIASYYGNDEVIKYLLSLEPKHNIEWTNDYNETPLLAALKNNQYQAFKLLLSLGANKNAIAYINKKVNIANKYLDKTTKKTAKQYAFEFCYEAKYHYLSSKDKLVQAAYKGDTRECLRLIDDGVIFTDRIKGYMYTPAEAANANKHRKLASFLMNKSTILAYKLDFNNSDFLKAACSGDLAALKNHLKSGENINQKNECGYTALMLASVNKHYKCIEFLINNHANVNLKNRAREDLIEVCTNHNSLESIQFLFKCINNYNQNNPRNTILYHYQPSKKTKNSKSLFTITETNETVKNTRNDNYTMPGVLLTN